MSDSEHSDWQKTTIDSAQAEQHPETAQAVAKIKALRQSIDNIDSAIVSLLAERFKATSQVGVLKAGAGFAPEDTKREDYQIERLHRIAVDAGLDPEIAEMYREFVLPTPGETRACLMCSHDSRVTPTCEICVCQMLAGTGAWTEYSSYPYDYLQTSRAIAFPNYRR